MVAAAVSSQDVGLSPFVLGILGKLFTQYPEIEKVLIFGSRATGRFRAGSDIDLAVFAPDLSDQAFAQLALELDEQPIAFNMDILHFDRLNDPTLTQQILDHGKTLYQPSANR